MSDSHQGSSQQQPAVPIQPQPIGTTLNEQLLQRLQQQQSMTEQVSNDYRLLSNRFFALSDTLVERSTAITTLQDEKATLRAETTALRAEKAAAIATLQAEKAALQAEIDLLNSTKCTFSQYLDRPVPRGNSVNLTGYIKRLPSTSGSGAGSSSVMSTSASGLSDAVRQLSTDMPPPPPPPPPPQQSSTIGNKRKRADADAPVKERAVLFTIHLNNQAHLVQANFGKQDEEAALQAVNVHLGMWADFGQCVSSNNAETIRNGRKGLVSWEYAARIERRMDNATVYNEAHLVSSYQQIVQDLVDTTDAANTARVNVIPETSVTSGRVDLMVYRDQQRHVAIEMKVPNGIGSDMRQEPQDLLQLMIDQHAKDTKSKQSVSSRAAGCLNQLINYLAKTTTEFGILSSYEHSWFVKRGVPIDGQESFFVSMSVPCTAEGPVTLRRALFYIINEVKIRAAGHSSPPPALWPTLEPTATPFDRDGWAVYRECAIHVCKSDARRCPCSGDKTLVTHDSGINLVQSTKPVLRLHDAIAQGRTGAGFIGCLDGQRVAIKGVSYTLCDDTNYDVIRREVAFYKEHEDLQGDAIPQVVEAVLSGDCAFLVMELGQRYRQWADADHALAEQALDKLHARHILHGDLHSGNVVFVGEGDECKARIIDLESARVHRGQDFDELAAKEKARVVRFGTPTEYDRRHDE